MELILLPRQRILLYALGLSKRALRILRRTQLGSILDDEINILPPIIDGSDEYLLNTHQIAAVVESDRLIRITK
jgi:hypothetical protein